MDFPFGETVTLVRRTQTGVDALGNDVYGTTEVAITNVAVAPRTDSEDIQGRDQVVVGLTLHLPAGTVVDAVDRFIVRGNTYEVEGQPEALQSPFTGWNPALPVAVTRVTG